MKYKALILEDNEMDASLMEQYLHRSEYNFEIRWVETGKAYEKAITDFEPDVIICDYRLKQYSGLDAIHHKNIEFEDVPLVIVSGTIGEEKAVELIKKGAADFLIKNNIASRLMQTVMRAIKESLEKEKRRKAELKLKSSEERFRMLFEYSLDGIIIGDPDNEVGVITANEAACKMLGYKYKELKGKTLDDFIDVNSDESIKNLENRDRKGYFRGELKVRTKGGELLPVDVSCRIMKLKDGDRRSYYIIRDISDRREAQQKMEESLKEKETLLKEIHHRVKNNLAVISGMMQLQAFNSRNEEFHNEMLGSVSRIKSIALIHEYLYHNESLSQIEISSNLKELVQTAKETFNCDAQISYNFNLESILLNVNQAVPFALMINEVTTNIYKHAFKDKTKGDIDLKLYEKGKTIILEIKDNGIGLPENFDLEGAETIGLTLIKTLGKQLNANIKFSSGEKTTFLLEFERSESKGSSNTLN